MLKVGLTGGIGSGKSTAAKVFVALGVPVYDSDSRAKLLMHQEPLRSQIIGLLGEKAYSGDSLDTVYIAGKVFKDQNLLAGLNAIVHPAVMNDFERWAYRRECEGYTYVVQENAILFDHGFDSAMDVTITVSAPEGERSLRAAVRDGRDREDVLRRIKNQMTDAQREIRADHVITNRDGDLIVPHIVRLHESFSVGNKGIE